MKCVSTEQVSRNMRNIKGLSYATATDSKIHHEQTKVKGKYRSRRYLKRQASTNLSDINRITAPRVQKFRLPQIKFVEHFHSNKTTESGAFIWQKSRFKPSSSWLCFNMSSVIVSRLLVPTIDGCYWTNSSSAKQNPARWSAQNQRVIALETLVSSPTTFIPNHIDKTKN